MLRRSLYDGNGVLRIGRLVLLLGITLAMAIFGGGLIWVVPSVTEDPLLRGLWVLFAIGALKVPLIVLLWSFIRRNREWPGRAVRWDDDEVAEILSHLLAQADDAVTRPDRHARLTYLAREAWYVADNASGQAKVDALTVALRIDERLIAERDRRTAQ